MKSVRDALTKHGGTVDVELPAVLAESLPEKDEGAADVEDEGKDADADAVGPLSLDEASGKDFAASQKGFRIGDIVFEKTVGRNEVAYRSNRSVKRWRL